MWLIYPKGISGDSQDELIDKDTIIEIKCPYSTRKYTPLEEIHDIYIYI